VVGEETATENEGRGEKHKALGATIREPARLESDLRGGSEREKQGYRSGPRRLRYRLTNNAADGGGQSSGPKTLQQALKELEETRVTNEDKNRRRKGGEATSAHEAITVEA